MLRWRIAFLVSVAIAISYLDRQTLSVAITEISPRSNDTPGRSINSASAGERDIIPISDSQFAALNSAFLAAYGLMYLGGGRLMDAFGTRAGFAAIMVFWSLACASQGLAMGFYMLAASRLLLGIGEGGGFPAATRAVAEWFPVKERSTAMGIINSGTAIGGIAAPPMIALVLTNVDWFNVSPWRWVFFITGAMGIAWTLWWLWDYYIPERHPNLGDEERALILSERGSVGATAAPIPFKDLLRYRETWGIVTAKFLSDAAWYFILFWLPKYLVDTFKFDIREVGSVAWIPHAAAGVGCLIGGSLSSWLLRRHFSLDSARKIALGASAVMMPLLILVPQIDSRELVIALFCVGYFGQQSWSTLVMVLPADLFPRRAVGTVAGMVGLGGALGGIVFGQLAGYLRDARYGYGPVFAIAGSLHVIAFAVILVTVRSVRPLDVATTSNA
jgi:ACS family hexuronate transporter-like MFS transporter